MNDTFGSPQEWLTVFAYLGFAVFVLWRVLVTQKK